MSDALTLGRDRALSSPRLLLPNHEPLCEHLLDAHRQDCSCSHILGDGVSVNGSISFHCLMCDLCDKTEDEVCVQVEYLHVIENTTNFNHRTKMRYSAGSRSEEIMIHQNCSLSEDLDLICTSCEVTVNNVTCNSCDQSSCEKDSMLPLTSVPKVDCSNIEKGAIYDPCTEMYPQFVSGDLLFGLELAIDECLRAATPDSLPPEVSAKCSAATKLEIGMDEASNFFDELVNVQDICSSAGYFSAAKFYRVVGTGNILTASTCRDGTARATTIAVFSGGCDYLKCTELQSHQFPSCGDPDSFIRFNSDEVSWTSEPDEIYYLLVMTIEAGDVQVGLTETTIPTNTKCIRSDTINLTSNDLPVTGSTVAGGAGPNCDIAAIREEQTDRGLWYIVIPERWNQSVFVASTCSEETNFASEIKVFSGTCESLTCVPHAQYEMCNDNGGSKVTWGSNNRIVESYYIFVTSVISGQVGNAGNFVLNVTEREAAPNSECSGAIPVEIGKETVGSNVAAANSEDAPFHERGVFLVAGPGVWYSVTPCSTSTLQVTTCFEATDPNFSAVIWVYRRDDNTACNAMEMVAVETGIDPECKITVGTKGNWAADEGVEYLLYIGSGTGELTLSQKKIQSQRRDAHRPRIIFPARANFAFSITEIRPPPNDKCEVADSSLTKVGVGVPGSTSTATRDFPFGFTCGNVLLETVGVWYTIEGTGSSLSTRACSTILDFSPQITLFEGESCDELTCIGTAISNEQGRYEELSIDGSSSTINWKSEADKTYYIYIHGGLGDFELSVTKHSNSLENHYCPQTLHIAPGQQISGNTSDTSTEQCSGDCCGYTIDSVGSWYSIEGAGLSMQITACVFGDDYSLSVSVLKGSCSNLTCLTGETFPTSCCSLFTNGAANRQIQPVGLSESLTWFAETGVSYKIFVRGRSHSIAVESVNGSFDLITNSIPSTEMPSIAPSESLGGVQLETVPPTEPPTNLSTSEPTPVPRGPAMASSTEVFNSKTKTSDSTATFQAHKTTIVLLSTVGLPLLL
jgi:hypothetical protein